MWQDKGEENVGDKFNGVEDVGLGVLTFQCKADEGGSLKSQEVQGGKLRGKRGWKTSQSIKGIGNDVIRPKMFEELIMKMVPGLHNLQYLDVLICLTMKYLILISNGTRC